LPENYFWGNYDTGSLRSTVYLPPMAIKRFRIFVLLVATLFSKVAVGQDSSIVHLDPSKPTNLYNRLSNNAEYNILKSGKRTFGYRANLVWASRNQHQSFQIEVPVLYSTASERAGLGDLRVRYYWIPYRDYSKKPGALGFVLDAYVPTGSFANGLGRGRWIWAPGLSTAFVFGKFSVFPIACYLYSGKINSGKISPMAAAALNGYLVQSTFVYKFRQSYLDLTPIFMKNSYSNSGHNDVVLEGNYLHRLRTDKFQIGGFARRYFLGRSTTIRLAMRVYFR
jgi:hypothetical protein